MDVEFNVYYILLKLSDTTPMCKLFFKNNWQCQCTCIKHTQWYVNMNKYKLDLVLVEAKLILMLLHQGLVGLRKLVPKHRLPQEHYCWSHPRARHLSPGTVFFVYGEKKQTKKLQKAPPVVFTFSLFSRSKTAMSSSSTPPPFNSPPPPPLPQSSCCAAVSQTTVWGPLALSAAAFTATVILMVSVRVVFKKKNVPQ